MLVGRRLARKPGARCAARIEFHAMTLHCPPGAGRPRPFLVVAIAGLTFWFAGAVDGRLAAQPSRDEHRVVVSTSTSDRDEDVEASLERHVNRLGAAGFEVAAILGGVAPVIDEVLARKPLAFARVDHGGQIAVVMRRRPGAPAIRREYRLLHSRQALGLDEIVAPLGGQGFVLTATSQEGTLFHAAFERRAGAPAVTYRVVQNRGRSTWMDQVQKDPAMASRLRRAVPMALDHALIELGAEATPPGALEWAGTATFRASSLESALNAKAAAGYRVQQVRIRQNELDVLLVRPAGPSGPAAVYDVDDGPWGGPCSRGTLAGADGYTDGDVYCVAENPDGGVSNRGFDGVLRVRSGAAAPLLEVPSCAEDVRLTRGGTPHARIVAAQQIERFLDKGVPDGYRLQRLLVVRKDSGEARLVAMATSAPAATVNGDAVDAGPVAGLAPDLDAPVNRGAGDRQREANERLARLTGVQNRNTWLDLGDLLGSKDAVLSGCVTTHAARTELEQAVRVFMREPPLAGYRLRNDLVVDPTAK
jgi:hypothetical protein